MKILGSQWMAVLLMPSLLASAACGSSGASSTTKATPLPQAVETRPAGDIPDTATYLRYRGKAFSIEYVEGWVQLQLSGSSVKFSDKDSFEQVTLTSKPATGLLAFVSNTGVPAARQEFRNFRQTSLSRTSIKSGPAVRLSFRAQSAPDSVTGKSVPLLVDRYYVNGPKNLAVVTLATPIGVDNIDAFRRIASSLRLPSR